MNLPLKKASASSNALAPSKLLLNSRQNNSGIGFAQVCGHHQPVTVRMPEGHAHYAALRCGDCGRLRRWLPAAWGVDGFTLIEKDSAYAKLRALRQARRK